MDNLTELQRSKCMSNIKRRDTKVEIVFRKAIWREGIRGYRIDVSLPGRPDIYFPKFELAVFIDGCFWHKCPQCYSEPKSKKNYWLPKIKNNVDRDRKNEKRLKDMGIIVIRYWEHEIKNELSKTIEKFINSFKEIKSKYEKRIT